MSNDDFALLIAKARDLDVTHKVHPWIIDSGCSSHLTFDRSAFVSYNELKDKTIVVGTKQETKFAGTGDIYIKVFVDGKPFKVRLMNVLHVPGTDYQILSVSKIIDKGLNAKFDGSRCHIMSNSRVVAKSTLRNSLYYLNLYINGSEIACTASIKLWHERLAHVNMNGI